jgi:penicillin-binding protein 2
MIRIKIVKWVVILMFFILSLALLGLVIIQGRKYQELSRRNCIRLLPQEGARGKIFDRQGYAIIDNKLVYDVMILPQEQDENDKVLMAVSGILEINFRDLKKEFKNYYVASSVPVTIAKNVDRKKAIALEVLKFNFPSIIIQPRPQRHYPYGRLASHIIGYVSEIDHWRLTKLKDFGYKTKDVVGFGGVEERYDYYLRQEEGGLSIEIDHRGRLMRVLGFRPARNGKNIQLTLNLKIQKITEEKLSDRKGSVIIMDPYNGEIIALVSSPDFAPSVFIERENYSVASLFNNPDAPLLNRAISTSYPAGSLFKVIVATCALETKKINLSTTFLCQGSTLIGRQEFICWDTHGQQNLIPAIAHSCNIFFYKTGLLLGGQAIHDYAVKFGLSRPTSFELPYEASGFIPSPIWRKIYKFQNWYDGDTANLSIGQGEVLVSPLQMLRVMAVFANGGYLVVPYIVKAVDGQDISVYQRKITNLFLKKSTIDNLRQGLREVISDPKGTGNVLSSLPISLAGKTGTAQAPPGQAHAWFIGFFPFKNPKFAICVFLERGGPGYYACVIARQIIEEMINEGLL